MKSGDHDRGWGSGEGLEVSKDTTHQPEEEKEEGGEKEPQKENSRSQKPAPIPKPPPSKTAPTHETPEGILVHMSA